MMRQRSSTGSDSRSTMGGRGFASWGSVGGAVSTPGRRLSTLSCAKAFRDTTARSPIKTFPVFFLLKTTAGIADSRVEERRHGAPGVAQLPAEDGDVVRALRAGGVADAGAQG